MIKKFDDVYPADWDDDEFEAYWEFINKNLARDYEPVFELLGVEPTLRFSNFKLL